MSKKFQTDNVTIIATAHFIHDIYTAFLAPVLPLLIEKLKLNYTFASLLTVIQRLPSLFNPLIGVIADRVQIRYLVIIAPATTTIFMSLIGVTSSYILLAIFLFVVGISSAMFHVPTPVMMQKVAGDRVGKAMSFYMIGGEAARTTGPLIITAAISIWGLEGTFRMIPFGIVASLILYFKLRKIKISDELKQKSKRPPVKEALKKHINFLSLIGAIIIFRGFMKSAIVTFLPTYLKERGESLWFGSASLSIFELSGVIGVLIAGSYSDKIGRMKTLNFIVFLTPACMLLFVLVNGFLVFPILLLLGFFTLASTPVIMALVIERDKHHKSFLNGIFMFFSFAASSLTAFLVGIVSDLTSLEETFKYAAYISFFTIPFLFWLNQSMRKPNPEVQEHKET